jgi:type IV pilus assembly protein PilM
MASEEQPTSIWKKELSFRRKPKSGFAAPDEVLVEVEHELALPEPIELAPKQEPAPTPEPDPELVPAASVSLAAPEHSWLTMPLEEISAPPEEPEPAPAPAPALVAEPVADPILAAVELPAVAEPAPVLEAQPLPSLPELLPGDDKAPELPPVADEPPAAQAKKVPFYKQELSLKRAPRERKPKADRPSKPARVKGSRGAASEQAEQPARSRRLSVKRAPKQWDAAEPAAEPKPKPKLRRPPRPRPSLPSLPSLPKAGAKRVVGLKIGGSQIAAACVANGAEPELLQAVREPLEHGIVVGGELRDPEALTVALREFFRRHKLPTRNVRLGIANNRIGVRTFDVVGIADPKQLANAIRFRAQEVLPIPLEEAVLDYQVLTESVNDDGQKVSRVLLVVAYRELVDRYVLACKRAGLQIVGIDLEAFALLRAIAEPRDPVGGSERAALVAVSVGHDRSTFAVSDGRICEFTRVLDWGGWALNIAIARALDISPSEAEPIKRALSLTDAGEAREGFSEHQLTAAHEAAKKQLQTFARELVSSLQFYQNQPGSLGIGEIVLTGGTAHLPGLGAELERLIGVPVRVADPLGRVKVSKKLRERDQVGSLAIAIGLGIDD